MVNTYILYFLPILILIIAANINRFENLKLDEKYCNQVAVGSHIVTMVFYAFLLYFLKIDEQPFKPFIFKTSFFIGIYLLNTIFLGLFFSIKRSFNLVTYVGLAILIFSCIDSFYFKIIFLMLLLNLTCRNYFNLILSNIVLFLFVGVSGYSIVTSISMLILVINSLLSLRKSTYLLPVIHFLLVIVGVIEFLSIKDLYISFYFSLLSVGTFFILLFNQHFQAFVPQFYFLNPNKLINLVIQDNAQERMQSALVQSKDSSLRKLSFNLDYAYLFTLLILTVCFLVSYE
ncbi:hypothetical protein N9N67_03205 [Bacteriovoracaceae bacterium]|nr:hypothetical protein [Bacteriovoracaceae bacterium]